MAFVRIIKILTRLGWGDRVFTQFGAAAVGTWAFGKVPGGS